MPNNPKALDNLKPFTGADDPRRGSKPKGAVHISTTIQHLLYDEDFKTLIMDAKDGWKEVNIVPVKAIIGVAIKRAIAGDNKWAEWLAKYGYGTKTEVQHSGELNTGISDPVLAAEFADFLKQKTKQ